MWIKYLQSPLRKDLEDFVTVVGAKKKICGPFRRMSPYKDEHGVWRDRSQMREFTPFTQDNKPAILLPRYSKYTELLMVKAHGKGHVGVMATVAKF